MKILIAYATLSGNTQIVAEDLDTYLKGKGHEVTTLSQDDLDPTQLHEYEYVFFGSSTWGDGEPNPTAEAFLAKLKNFTGDFGNAKIAIFGLGDSSYPSYCGVVHQFEDALKEKQKATVIESIKIDGYPDDNAFAQVHEWADKALAG